MANTDISRLLAMPDPDELGKTATRTFTVERGGQAYSEKITIRADGKADAAFYATLLGIIGEPIAISDAMAEKLQLSAPLVMTVPNPGGQGVMRIEVTDRGFISQLKLLEAVSVDPLWKKGEWALFARKYGSVIMSDLHDWAQTENGLTQWLAGKMNDLKNALGAEDMTLPDNSSAPSGENPATFLNGSSPD